MSSNLYWYKRIYVRGAAYYYSMFGNIHITVCILQSKNRIVLVCRLVNMRRLSLQYILMPLCCSVVREPEFWPLVNINTLKLSLNCKAYFVFFWGGHWFILRLCCTIKGSLSTPGTTLFTTFNKLVSTSRNNRLVGTVATAFKNQTISPLTQWHPLEVLLTWNFSFSTKHTANEHALKFWLSWQHCCNKQSPKALL